jgi:hypothetical protein
MFLKRLSSTTSVPKLRFTNTAATNDWRRMAGTGVAYGRTFHPKTRGSMRSSATA